MTGRYRGVKVFARAKGTPGAEKTKKTYSMETLGALSGGAKLTVGRP